MLGQRDREGLRVEVNRTITSGHRDDKPARRLSEAQIRIAEMEDGDAIRRMS